MDEPDPGTLADIAGAWTTDADGNVEPNWLLYRAHIDSLRRHPEHIATAISHAPPTSGSPIIANLLAGIAEILADEAGIPPPSWTQDIRPLQQPWTPTGSRPGRPHTWEPVLLARGIHIDAGGLIRSRRTPHPNPTPEHRD